MDSKANLKALLSKAKTNLDWKYKPDSTNDKSFSLTLFNRSIIAFYSIGSMGWIRVFGWVLVWKDGSRYPLTFSERYGYSKRINIGRWMFRLIRRQLK